MNPPTRANGNRGQQILQLVTQPPPTPDLGKKSQASNARASIHLMWQRLRNSL